MSRFIATTLDEFYFSDIAESAKLERCVKDVKADDVDEPWAVCRAALGECKTDDCQCKGCRKLRECKATRKPGPCKKATGPNAKMKKVKPQEHVLRQLLGDWYSAAAAAKGAASRIGANVWGKLPAEVQKRLGQTWGAAKAVEHKVMIGFRKAEQLAKAAAAERGLPTKHVATVGRILATADVVSAWTVNMPAAYAATGSATVAKVASWVPVASLAYIAYSSARNPFAVVRAAKQVIAGTAHESLDEGEQADAVGLLLQRLVDNDGSDWYLALLAAAMDSGHELGQAIVAADAAIAEQPEAGDDDEPLLLECGGEGGKPGPCPEPGGDEPRKQFIPLKNLQTLASAVHAAGQDLPDSITGRPGRDLASWQSHKPWIVDVYRALKGKLGHAGAGDASLDDFKQALFAAFQAGKVKLSRTDLGHQSNPLKEKPSAIAALNATWHLVDIPRS